jgi:alpha-tubulin suppressor-like RCC1 family protein
MEAPQVVLLARVFDAHDQPSLSDIVQVDLGAFHSCALGSSGAIYCWGDDHYQQLGSMLGLDNNNNRNDLPAPLPGRAQRVRRFGSMR